MTPSVVMLGATGAVGGAVLDAFAADLPLAGLESFGRRDPAVRDGLAITSRIVDVTAKDAFNGIAPGHDVAICTLGVGQPTKVSRDTFVEIDKTVVLNFAAACRAAGVAHFQLLGSVGANARSPSFFLRTKGELEDGLRALKFPRLSLFHPSMILTPENRYGVSQAVTLAVWPLLTPLLAGPLRRYRGIPVARLGRALAVNAVTPGQGEEVIEWDRIMDLSGAG